VKSPEHSVAVAAAEARLVVDDLVGGHLLHLVHALATLVTRSIVLHHSRPDGRMDAEKFYIPPNTHPFNGPFSGTTQVSRYQKGKTNLDFTEARKSEWQWHQLGHMQVCTLLQTTEA